MRTAVLYTLSLFLVMAFQLLLLENVQLLGYLNPYYYPLLVLLWPLKWNRALSLVVAFGLGSVMDFFENSGGLHTSALVLLAYVRPFLLQSLVARAVEEGLSVDLPTLGPSKFLTFTAMGLFVFHFWLFSLEAFAWSELFWVLIRSLASTAVSTAMIYATQLLVVSKE
jgi:rod shape-determining protein MreD